MVEPAPTSNGPVREIDRGPSFELWKGPAGGMRLDWTRQGAVRIIVVGHGHGEYSDPAIRRWDIARRTCAKAVMAIDFWEMPTYDSAMRVKMTAWTMQHRSDAEPHVLQRSKIVFMGLTVAN